MENSNHFLQRKEAVRQALQKAYAVPQSDIRVVRSPLRVCPLGAHIDHQMGPVTGTAIDRSILLAFAPLNRPSVRLQSLDFEGEVQFSLDEIPPAQGKDWGNYPRGAASALKTRYPLPRGLAGVLSGDLPVGGLSSSAAVGVACLLALEAVNDLGVLPLENIDLDRLLENGYIGLNNGILDQSMILLSEEGKLVFLDCLEYTRNPERSYRKVPFGSKRAKYMSPLLTEELLPPPTPPSQGGELNMGTSPSQGGKPDSLPPYRILVAYSGVTEALVGTGYNKRVDECQKAGRALMNLAGLPAEDPVRLRSVPREIYERNRERLAEVQRKRADHFFGECARVEEGIRAWEAGDLETFGRLMNESGLSSIEKYECGSPELKTLYEILIQTEGVLGTRFSGAGFRGSCIALVDPNRSRDIEGILREKYPRSHPERAKTFEVFHCSFADGATILDT